MKTEKKVEEKKAEKKNYARLVLNVLVVEVPRGGTLQDEDYGKEEFFVIETCNGFFARHTFRACRVMNGLLTNIGENTKSIGEAISDVYNVRGLLRKEQAEEIASIERITAAVLEELKGRKASPKKAKDLVKKSLGEVLTEVKKTAKEEKKAKKEEKKEEKQKAEEAAKKEEEAKKEEAKKEEAAPTEDKHAMDLKKRRDRIREIYAMRDSKNEEDVKKLQEIVSSETTEPFEKATAMRVLPKEVVKDMIPQLKKLADQKDLAVRSEAAILLYKNGEKEFARPKLEELVTQGLAVRRAFFKGVEDGKFLYEEEAEGFFRKEMEAQQIHVRLDGALGLLHIGKTEEAVKAFKEALQNRDQQHIRLTAVSYLASVRDMPEAQKLLELAAKDPDPKVSMRARQILTPRVAPKTAPKADQPK